MSLQERSGRAVRRVRAAQGHSQEGFTAEAGINRGYMGRIEQGEVNISLENIGRLAAALKLTVGQLMIEVDKEK